jgi:hypothetical protein
VSMGGEDVVSVTVAVALRVESEVGFAVPSGDPLAAAGSVELAALASVAPTVAPEVESGVKEVASVTLPDVALLAEVSVP